MNAPDFGLRPMTTTVNDKGEPIGIVCAVQIESLGDGAFSCLANIHGAVPHGLLHLLIGEISESLHAQFDDMQHDLKGEDHGH